jgi:aspartate aminotransferase
MATLGNRLKQLTPSATMHMTALAERMRAEGHDVIGLAGGESDYDTAENVKEAGIGAIRANITRYPPGNGREDLRRALSLKLRQDNNLDYQPDQILVSSGTKPLINAALMALADAGDEVIVPTPYWVSYPEIVRLAGQKPVFVPCPASNGFRLQAEDLAAAITPRTRALLLNSPNNPSGAVYREADLRELLEVLLPHPDVWILTDEIYEDICYLDERPVSFAALDPRIAQRVITINGFSKGYAMAGWRVGFAAGPKSAINAMQTVVWHINGGCTSISQVAAAEAVSGDRSYLERNAKSYRARRDLAVTAINQMPGLTCATPDGSFFLWVDCAGAIGRRTPGGKIIESDSDFVAGAIEHAGIVMLPGLPFGMSPYFRMSYSIDAAILRKALDRLHAYCSALT